MHKEKLKTEFKGNRSIPDPGTSRPENVSQNSANIYAHNAPARRAGSKALGQPIMAPLTALEDAVGTHCGVSQAFTVKFRQIWL